ncbi:hypothetical protein ACQ86D_27790 [Streptomyces galilaeus]
MIKTRILSVAAAGIAVVGLIGITPQAQAASNCGNYWPSSGKLIQSYSPASGTYTATTLFTFTPSEISALKCTKDVYYEVDMLALDGIAATGGSRKMVDSNLPGASYVDTDYRDDVRTLTIGTNGAQSMAANTEYRVTASVSGASVKADRSRMALTFQHNHWVGVTEGLPRRPFWDVCQAHGGHDPAWCVNPTESHAMANDLGPTSYVDMRRPFTSTISTTWGSYRKDHITPVNQMVPGDKIFSPNSLNFLLMQSDGNLVEYIPGNGAPRAAWASNTAGNGNEGSVFIAQNDGNYVLVAPGNHARWATGTGGPGTTFKIQDDRNLVVYGNRNNALWSNNIAGQP